MVALILTGTRGRGLWGTNAWITVTKTKRCEAPRHIKRPWQRGHHAAERKDSLRKSHSRRHAGHAWIWGKEGLRGQRRQRQTPQRPGQSFPAVG